MDRMLATVDKAIDMVGFLAVTVIESWTELSIVAVCIGFAARALGL